MTTRIGAEVDGSAATKYPPNEIVPATDLVQVLKGLDAVYVKAVWEAMKRLWTVEKSKELLAKYTKLDIPFLVE